MADAGIGLGVVIALRELAADGADLVALELRLHALRGDGEPQDVRQFRHGRDDGAALGVLPMSGDEALVDLDDVDGQPTQIAQR